jgi:hypothetical protein
VARPTVQTRLYTFPHGTTLVGARLDAVHDESRGTHRELVLDYHELHPLVPLTVSRSDGRLREHVEGYYVPRRLRFVGVQRLDCTGLFACLEDLPLDHAARTLLGVLHWRPPGMEPEYRIFNRSTEQAPLVISAQRCVREDRDGPVEHVTITREWSPAPPMTAGRIAPTRSRRLYGGDPVTIRVGGRYYHRRLFVGGIFPQTDKRPIVDAVLNVGEEPSRWTIAAEPHPADRWVPKGEAASGMDVVEMVDEATWVIERLRAGQRVLVHCVAGLNRSVSLCCAVLMLLEGISPEAALERIRTHHPFAQPDPYHWLVLRWLTQASSDSASRR